MSKSVMIIDTPIDCCECPFGTMAFGKSVCLLDEGNGIDCPLKPYKDAIPIEWINSYTTGLIFSDEYIDNTDSIDYYIDCIKEMVRDWEKENGEKTV